MIIQFERKDEVDGYYLLLVAGVPVRTSKYIGKHRYSVPVDSLSILEQEKIRYKTVRIK